MPKKRWRRRGRRAASSHSSSPAKRTPTRPLDYRHDEPDDRLTVRARATGRGARSSRRTPQSVVPEKEKTGSYTTREPCLNGAEAEVVSRLPHTSRGVPHTRRGVGVRLGDGQGEDRLEAQEERSQIVHTFSVSDGTRSRARRGAGRYSPAGSRRPSRRAGRPRGLVGSAQVEEEASPVPWAGKPRRLGKGADFYFRRRTFTSSIEDNPVLRSKYRIVNRTKTGLRSKYRIVFDFVRFCPILSDFVRLPEVMI